MERADGQIQENRYDAEGLRHEMRENEKLFRFVYQNGELLYEEGGDKETASCHLGAGIEAVRRGQRTYYYHPDEQLSTALITDETGTIKNQYRYDAFGAGLEVSEELPNRIRYTGQQYDGVTEQYYLRARYYNPILGRFLQEDVYQGDGLNLYAYCRNNPVVYWNPSGYESVNTCVKDKIGKSNGENTVPPDNSSFPQTRQELHQDLISRGFHTTGTTDQGYVVYKDNAGHTVSIKPTGEVIPTTRMPVDPTDTSPNARRYNQRTYYNGVIIPEELNDHTTGHYVGSISENDFYPEPYKWDGPKASWMNRGEE